MHVYLVDFNVYTINSMYFWCYKVTDVSQISLLQGENHLGTTAFTFPGKQGQAEALNMTAVPGQFHSYQLGTLDEDCPLWTADKAHRSVATKTQYIQILYVYIYEY